MLTLAASSFTSAASNVAQMQRLTPDSSLKLRINVGSEREDAEIKLALLKKAKNNPGSSLDGKLTADMHSF